MKLFRILCFTALLSLSTNGALAQTNFAPQAPETSVGAQVALSAIVEPALRIEFADEDKSVARPDEAAANKAEGHNIASEAASANVFELDFGKVNGLGVGHSREGGNVTVQPDGALYTMPVTLRVYYTGFSETNANVSVKLDGAGTNQAGRQAVREGATTFAVAAPNETPTSLATVNASGTEVTRQVGLFISNANGPNTVNGPVKARLVYQIILP